MEQVEQVDFRRDVLPLFRQHCYECHGPTKQKRGYRLDRRSVAMRGPTPVIVPGNSVASRLYHRVLGKSNEFGNPMPPSGPLKPNEIAVIKTWIDQGAEWPDDLANEADLPPVDPKAVELIETLRGGGLPEFLKRVTVDSKLLDARGPNGATPFMFAVLYCDVATLGRLLALGADPNKASDGNITALMWAGGDLGKVRLLVEHGAKVNARSDDARTALFIAAGQPGSSPTVKYLLDHGADPNPSAGLGATSTPLIEAALAGDADSVRLLLEHGAEAQNAGGLAMGWAIAANCWECVELITKKKPNPMAYTTALQIVAVFGDAKATRFMLDHGADVNAANELAYTPLMYAAGSDLVPVEAVKLLLERGAHLNVKERFGKTALDFARLRGDTPVVALLAKAGATGTKTPAPRLKLQKGNTPQAAVQRSLPVLQRSDVSFIRKTGCVSCHNNSLPAMTVSLARKQGLHVDEEMARRQVQANATNLGQRREGLLEGIAVATAGPGIVSYILLGLNAEQYKPDLNTDVVAMFLKTHQMPDGHWVGGPITDRPPLCTEDIGQTAQALRALQLYAPNTADKAAYESAVARAAAWLVKAQPKINEARAWRLMGLAWAGKDTAATQSAMKELLALQRADGGWADLPSLNSGPFATGQSLVALHTAGLPVTDSAYQRGVQFLLSSQVEDGSWFAQSRALGFQPQFENDFPHGTNQWISAAATSWAAMALALASPAPGEGTAHVDPQ
ncbi:MAG: ankyrin repeat domain-containing protein [Archangium sp.]